MDKNGNLIITITFIYLNNNMDQKRMWIMDEATLRSFDEYREERYKAADKKGNLNDDLLTQYYTSTIVYFFRKRKMSKDEPYKTDKFIHVAICLFKRFYLVNLYEEYSYPDQHALCCIYLSLKINDLTHESILNYAKAWKTKKSQQIFNEECVHFGDPEYSQKQLYFLRGIGFQIGRSPLIPAVQSLFYRLSENVKQKDHVQEVQKHILQILRRIYTDHSAIFLYEGPKLGLAVVVQSIKQAGIQKNLDLTIQKLLGPEISILLQKNEHEINRIVHSLSILQKFQLEMKRAQIKELRDKFVKTKKRTFQIPQKKSPKSTPLNYEFRE